MRVFSGAYLYSGGEEAVLVFWQVDTNHKQFKPRLGVPIAHICNSQDDTMIAVCHIDNGKMCTSVHYDKAKSSYQYFDILLSRRERASMPVDAAEAVSIAYYKLP